MRIIASIGTLLAVALACATPVRAQEFPSKPIKLIVPYAAGGGTDIVARIVAQKLQDKWGPAVIVENRAGAGGNVGAEAVFTAAPDGYTLLFTAQGPLVVNQYLFEKLAYEPDKFTPVSLVVVAYSALLASSGARPAGAHRLCQGESQQAQLRLPRDRHRRAPDRRAVQVDG